MKISLLRDLSEISRMVQATRAFFAAEGLPEALAYAVDLATEELFVNMIKYNTRSRDPIELELQSHPCGIAVSLTDRCPDPFDPRAVAPVATDVPLDERQAGGLGLHLVSHMVEAIDYEYRDGCSKVSFIASAAGTGRRRTAGDCDHV